MMGTGPRMEDLKDRIRRAAPTEGRILITGENGTGKELVAQAVHGLSLRREKPFVKLNCAAVPESLFESELFGHVRGAFTGALENRRGKFERADGGTLFLDEVAEIPIHLQAKLLRAIETGEVERLGGKGEFHVDVRLVAATNVDLERSVADGRFRPDLYYRLNVIRLHLPPLRERAWDIPALALRFLHDCCRLEGYSTKEMSTGALEQLKRYDYPGNVRELRNAVERLIILTPGRIIQPADVARTLHHNGLASGPTEPARGLRQQVEAFERELVERTLVRHQWNMAAAARALGLERSHLYKKMKSLGLGRPSS
ncbi:MAG: sigma-54 interaction domain-containing protein [Acidobacteriota bacterium]